LPAIGNRVKTLDFAGESGLCAAQKPRPGGRMGTFADIAAYSGCMKVISFVLCAGLLGGMACAQNSDSGFNLSLHAHDKVSAADIGLPQYPGSVADHDKDNSDSADLGFAFGDTKFNLRVASYKSSDSEGAVLAFYRKALARYGDVLECDHGKATGNLQRTHAGLTCGEQHGGHDGNLSINGMDSSDDHELRAGSPQTMRIAAVEPKGGGSRISLVYLELPKDSK
jgi:hypothetical protein